MVSETPDWIGMLAPGDRDGEGPCPTTRAGWLWYCDEHDTHGNADVEAEAHRVFWGGEPDADVEGECAVYVWKVETRAPR